MKCVLHKYSNRDEKGSSLLELPIALWITMIIFVMPMLSLASITLRATLLNVAVQDAIQSASKAQTFEQAGDGGPSAKDIAAQVFQDRIAALPGFAQADISVDIRVISIFGGGFQTTEKLFAPADTSKQIFQIEGIASAKVDPIFAQSPEIFGQIPGLTSPLTISADARRTAENPQGLNH